jgi:hypothetical protein
MICLLETYPRLNMLKIKHDLVDLKYSKGEKQ